jgi:sortase A
MVSRLLRILSVALITAGVTVLTDVGATLAWREPISSIYGSIRQSDARDELARLEDRFPSRADLRRAARAPSRRRALILARAFEHRIHAGDAIGRIRIDAIDLDMVVIQGTDTASLERGPGHYEETDIPGEPGTVAIAGHRTTYLAPFRHLDQLQAGDSVTLEMPYGTFTYRVERQEIVDPSDVGITRDVGHPQLVLTACNPLYSAAQRIVVFARLSGTAAVAGDAG